MSTAAPPEHQPLLGLELKASWAQRILRREKLVELRRYPIPSGYLHQPVLLLQTPDECPGVSTLPQHELPAGFAGAVVAGTVVFDGQTAYTSYEQFLADVDKHCVQPGSTYAWEPGVTQAMHGWHIASVTPAEPPQPVPAMRRVQSSWFEATTSCGGG